MNPARRLFPICVSSLSFTHLRFGIVNPYGTSCVSTSRSPRRLSHRQFGLCNPHRESACLLSEALGRSHIGILDLTTLTGAGRLSPLSHDSLVAMSCSLINFSSRASSRWVHMDVTFESHLPLSGSLPDLPWASSALPPEAGNRHPVPRVSFRYSNSMLDTTRFSHKVKYPAKIP